MSLWSGPILALSFFSHFVTSTMAGGRSPSTQKQVGGDRPDKRYFRLCFHPGTAAPPPPTTLRPSGEAASCPVLLRQPSSIQTHIHKPQTPTLPSVLSYQQSIPNPSRPTNKYQSPPPTNIYTLRIRLCCPHRKPQAGPCQRWPHDSQQGSPSSPVLPAIHPPPPHRCM